MRNALVVGQSHMISAALAINEHQITLNNKYRFIQLIDDKFSTVTKSGIINDELIEEINSSNLDVLVSMIYGNEHSVFGLLNHPQKFDFILPENPHLPIQSDAELVPFWIVKRRLEERSGHVFRLLRGLRSAISQKIKMGHVESPPPNPSEEHIRKHPGVFAARVNELGVAPSSLRYKLWRLNSSLMRSACADNGVHFIAAPAAMLDKNGMLPSEAWNPDPTHANMVYGRHVLLEIDKFASD